MFATIFIRAPYHYWNSFCSACLTGFVLTFFLDFASAQVPHFNVENGTAKEVQIGSTTFQLARPLVSYQIGEKTFNSTQSSPIKIMIEGPSHFESSLIIMFINTSRDTLHLHNVLPFAPSEKDLFITGKGDHRLSRTHLFQPGREAVNVIVPDNAWELGYCSFSLTDDRSLFGLVRRDLNSLKNAIRRRFETILDPGGSVSYSFYANTFHGSWQEGLRKCFQEKKLYDLEAFDESLYKREDLKWVRKAYVMHLMMAWDKDFYDATTNKLNWTKFLQRGDKLYGGDDVICLWPTWPSLGLDQRNQFDMYRDLPGGLKTLKVLTDTLRSHHTKFFIAYNPWDESTRGIEHLQGLADLIRETSADGVVLDTKGESSRELQEAADKVKPGVIMYSEGMAIPKDMPGILAGRVHNALYYPPMLNLNKLIRPDFAIFRVAEVYKEPIQREYAVSFFNGYGTEINQFAPGHPPWEEDQYRFLGKTSRILRENTLNFNSNEYVPLIPTTVDSIWVNRWPQDNKTLYTIFSLKPAGFSGSLFEIKPRDGFHWIDLWHHQAAEVSNSNSKSYVKVELDAFNQSFMGTNNEGQVMCLAELPTVLHATLKGNRLSVSTAQESVIKIWAGEPSYEKTALLLSSRNNQSLDIHEKFGRFEGKIVVQAFDNDNLLDEVILFVRPGLARRISETTKTAVTQKLPTGMVKVPIGKFQFKATHGDEFIPYPTEGINEWFDISGFYMDRNPVTNQDFKIFLDATRYAPSDTTNFLKHWINKKIPEGQERFSVVYISYEDARAYATWSGKRLPTEIEWQYAGQTDQLNEWPWRQDKPVRRKEQFVTETLTVTAIEGIDPRNCNLGDGKPYPVGKFPKGSNQFGLQDLTGCVWQLTNDVYESGSYRYIMMKGGSYFKPSSSWWYVQGGPRELHYRQFLLRVSQGFERNATVGFRCVMDSK